MDAIDAIQRIAWICYFAYTNRNKILELAKKNKVVRYALMPIAFPIAFGIIVYMLYYFHKHPDFMLWAEGRPKQTKITDY
jgi:hypothetical protein